MLDVRYTIAVDGVSNSYYALSCNEGIYSNHPKNEEACNELAAYVEKAKASQEKTATALHNALAPDQSIANPFECVVSGGEATLNIFYGKVNNKEITQGNERGYLTLRYRNGCYMQMIAKQAKLDHLIPFSGANGIPTAPLPKEPF